MSVFLDTNHLLLRDPRGGVEDVAAMRDAGFRAIFCNIGDHDPDAWSTVRARAATAGVACGPWLRVADNNNQFDFARFGKLLEVADAWQSPLVVNAESELQGTGATLTTYLDAQFGSRDAAVSMEPWPFDNVEWWPLKERPMLPQLSKADSSYEEQALREIWHGYGIDCVVLTFGAFGGSRPINYDRLAPYGVFFADDCNGDYQAWRQQGSIDPCVPQPPPDGGDMTKIGPDHGVTAAVNRLRDLDPKGTSLVKTGGKWPSVSTLTQPVKDWKAWDKLERSLTILVSDHDKEA